ncbi:MAG: hypothetical protein KC493_08040 [Bacteriovoracaceae bacterium]|nr:hypothetical protein [Bacteriovoracaceae bacterium]
MSYEFYKSLHLLMIFSFLVLGTLNLVTQPTKLVKIGTGVTSFLIMVAGMGLLARIGSGFTGWVIVKAVIWLLLAGLIPVAGKRFSEKGKQMTLVAIVALSAIAAFFAINKPF